MKQNELEYVEKSITSANELQRFIITNGLDISVGEICGNRNCIVVDKKHAKDAFISTQNHGIILLK